MAIQFIISVSTSIVFYILVFFTVLLYLIKSLYSVNKKDAFILLILLVITNLPIIIFFLLLIYSNYPDNHIIYLTMLR